MTFDAIRGITDVVTDPAVLAGHCQDWTGHYHGMCAALVQPRTTEQVQQIVRWANETRTPLVVQGGNTGLVGAAVPMSRDSVVLVTTGLRERLEVIGTDAVASAGYTVSEVQQVAARNGRHYGVDLAARDSATIGGTVATNAGGLRVCRYGMTRAQVAGIRAVLGSGDVVERMAGLIKDNTGYDLPGLLTGSEGTLAVITEVRLRLHAIPPPTVVAVWPIPDLAEAVGWLRDCPADVYAAEVVTTTDWQAVGGPSASVGRWMLLVEVDQSCESIPDDAVVGFDAATARHLWSYREAQPELAVRRGVVHKVDVSLPLDRLDEFVTQIEQVGGSSIFGHVGDGSLHVQLYSDTLSEILGHVVACGGAISAEHGIGRQKAGDLVRDRGPEQVAAMRSIKAALDPRGILNPGVLFT